MKTCSESFKEGYQEKFMAQLRKMVCGDEDINMNFIHYVMNQI
jgi:hypothetical protein